jgi:hypothetical protein
VALNLTHHLQSHAVRTLSIDGSKSFASQVVASYGAMVIALLASLGMLLSSAPGLGGLIRPHDAGPPPPAGAGSLPLLHTGSPYGLPSPASREEAGESDPEEKEEESDTLLALGAALMRDRTAPIRRRDRAIALHGSGRGLLHELHHSWQLLC